MATDLELRDSLALDRTALANERTLLAYVRTGLALIGAGAGVLVLIEAPAARLIAWISIAAGALTLPLGLWRYLVVRRHLNAASRARR